MVFQLNPTLFSASTTRHQISPSYPLKQDVQLRKGIAENIKIALSAFTGRSPTTVPVKYQSMIFPAKARISLDKMKLKFELLSFPIPIQHY